MIFQSKYIVLFRSFRYNYFNINKKIKLRENPEEDKQQAIPLQSQPANQESIIKKRGLINLSKNEIQPTHSKYLADPVPAIVTPVPINNRVIKSNNRRSTFETYEMNSARINNISRIQPIVSSSSHRKHNTSVFDSKLPISFDAYMMHKSESMNNQPKSSKNLNKI